MRNRWSRKRDQTPVFERANEQVSAGKEALAGDQPADSGRGEVSGGDDGATTVLHSADQAADRVAGIFEAAEEAAQEMLAEAREEARGIRRKADGDASARLRELLNEAERMRAEADEYVANMRLAADSYADERQAAAEGQARRLLEQAEAEAGRVREAAVPEEEEEEEKEEAPAAGPGPVRGRLELTAVAAVMSRDITVFFRSWRSTTFSAIVEPIVFLLAFGLGFGALISNVEGVDYIQFVGTGVVAATIVFSSAFPGMFQTFIKGRLQKTYDALLSTPVNVDELVTAEVLWISIRTGVYATAPIVVAVAFGLRPGWGIVFVPLIAFLTAFGLAAFGVTIAAIMKAIQNFSYIISAVLTPLVLLAGTYFPVDTLPKWAYVADHFNPLYHCVELVRHAAFGFERADLGHVGALVFIAVVMWRVAIWKLRPRLID
jgi:lipooligosaccharide transport system permease protein